MSPPDAGAADEELYRAVFEVNGAVKLLIDPADGRIVDANQAAARFYGWSREHLRSMRIMEINTQGEAEIAIELEAARAGRRGYFRFQHRTACGEVRHVEVYTGPVVVRGRELLLSIIQDTTERDLFEAQLRQAQRLEAIGRLAGGIAHDFNNLLTVVLAGAQAVRRRHGRDPAIDPYLDDVIHAAQRGGELTRQLLALGRRQAMHVRLVDLADLAERLAGILRRTFGERIALVVDIAARPAVLADPSQLEQVVLNLALNARDAMPRGGQLTVRVDAGELPADVRRPDSAAGAHAVLTVADTGHGIEPETLAHVFEPCFSTKAEGSGLGLAIAYGIIAQSGGRMVAESELGKGATFHVYLPVWGGQAGVEEAIRGGVEETVGLLD